MKKILLSLIPAILIVSGCAKTPEDPLKINNQQELVNALTFKNMNNFELDVTFMLVTDYGTHDEVVGDSAIYYFKNSTNEYLNEFKYSDIVTSEEKYQQYCEDQKIEYKKSDFLAMIDYYEQHGYQTTIVEDLYTLRRKREENRFTKFINSYSVDTIFNYNDKSYTKTLEFDNYGYDHTKKYMFETDYVKYSMFTYDEENERYNIGEQSLGGLIYPCSYEENRFDTYSVKYAYASFLNKKLNKIDIMISGQYEQHDRSLCLTVEVKNINNVDYDIPAAEYEVCDHEDVFWSESNKWHYRVCEDCDCFIEGTQGKCQYDTTGKCTTCHSMHTYNEIILSYDFFGYPMVAIDADVVFETKLVDGLRNGSCCLNIIENFDLITFTDDPSYYTKSVACSCYLYYKCGTKTCVTLNDGPYDYVFPETYTFETRNIQGVDKRVMVISKTYHEGVVTTD